MKSIQYDNPNDIDSLSTLKIKAGSGNPSPQIYANGKNQLPIQITVQAVNKDGKVLNFSNDTWLSILSLCFSENGEKLTKKGSSGWCYTDVINDYSEEILFTENFQIEPLSVQIKKHLIFYKESKNTDIIMYVYSYDANKIKRISVNLDTNNGKHFTTADNPVGAKKMSVAIKTLRPIYYDTKNIDFNYTDFSRGEAKWSKDKYVYLTTRQRNYNLTAVYNNRFIKNYSFSNFSETENNKQLGSGWFYFDFHRYLYVGYCWQPDVISPHAVTIYDKKMILLTKV